jgi:hypothetical protein
MNALITLFIQKLCIRPNENMLFGYLEGAKKEKTITKYIFVSWNKF